MKRQLILPLLLGLAPVLLTTLVLLPILSRGMYLSRDSILYLMSAVNFVGGHGLARGCAPNVIYEVQLPPGYALALALPIWFGLDWLSASRLVALLTYFFLISSVSLAAWAVTQSAAIALVAALVVGIHPVILQGTGSVLSEPLFWLFVVAIVHLLTRLVTQPSTQRAVALGAVMGGAMLVRYVCVGFVLGAMVTVFLLLRSNAPWARLRIAALLGLLSGTIFGAWLVRCLWLAGPAMAGGSSAGKGSLARNLAYVVLNGWSVMGGWWSPSGDAIRPHGPAGGLIAAPLALLAIVALRRYRRAIATSSPATADVAYVASWLLAVCYGLAIALLRTSSAPIDLTSRMFSPLIPLFVLMLASLAKRPDAPSAVSSSGSATFALFALLIGVEAARAVPALQERALGYFDWQSSPTLRYVAGRFAGSEILATDPEPFWLWHGDCVGSLPRAVASAERGSPPAETKALVWFTRPDGQLGLRMRPEEMLPLPGFVRWEFADGFVYAAVAVPRE